MKAREIWEEARRWLVERYLKDTPGATRSRAYDVVSNRHEEIGAVMDEIERHQPLQFGGRTGA